MTATLEPQLDHDFNVITLTSDDPFVLARQRAFLKRYHLPDATRPIGWQWWGIAEDGAIVLLVGTVKRPDNSLEIADFYPLPTRAGVKAAYFVGEFLKYLVDSKQVSYIVGSVFVNNRWMRTHWEKVFRVGPKLAIYVYSGEQ
jgi:hypothetical protein